jgi:hypothetical protein
MQEAARVEQCSIVVFNEGLKLGGSSSEAAHTAMVNKWEAIIMGLFNKLGFESFPRTFRPLIW